MDAARDVILSVGWKRATVAEVARRAGVSRMTFYRAYPDMQSIAADLMTREWVAEINAIVSEVAPGRDGWADVIARRISAAVQAFRGNALFRQIVDVDPELLVPYLTERRGRAQDAILEVLAARIADAQSTNTVRSGDPKLMARSLLLCLHGFAMSVDTMADDGLCQADFDAELTTLTRRYLAP